MRRDIVVFGYFGRGNLGDEKNLEQIVALVKRHFPERSLTVISADPAETEQRLGINAVGKFDFWRIEATLWRSRFLLGGCGNVFQDQTSLRSLLYYSGLVFLAKLNGCRVILYGQGIGPIMTRLGKWIAGKVFALTDLIIARDRLSVGALWDLNAIRSELHFTVDPLLALPKASEEKVRDTWTSLVQGGEPRIGLLVHLNPAMDKIFWENLVKYLKLQKNRGIYIITIDAVVNGWQETASRLGVFFIHENHDWERLQCILGGLDLVVSAKLHGLVAAVNQGVPCYGLAIDPKIEGFCLQLDIPYDLVKNGQDSRQLSEAIGELLTQPFEERRRWLAKIDFWKVLAHENGYILTDYLKRL